MLLSNLARVKVSFPRGKQVKTVPSLLTATPYDDRLHERTGPFSPSHLTHCRPEVKEGVHELDGRSKAARVKVDLRF